MPRLIGSALGLLAFSTAILAGLWARNPFGVVLSRAIWAMVLFCLIGLLLGWAVQIVVREHIRRKVDAAAPSEEKAGPPPTETVEGKKSREGDVKPMGT